MRPHRHLRVLETSSADSDAAPAPLRVAFATTDRKSVDRHFGAAECFAVYAVTANSSQLVEIVEFGRPPMYHDEDKLAGKISALARCAAVYCTAIGSAAIARLLAAGIHPVKVEPRAAIAGLLAELRREFRRGPSSWLARAMERQHREDPGRFSAMEAEGWEE